MSSQSPFASLGQSSQPFGAPQGSNLSAAAKPFVPSFASSPGSSPQKPPVQTTAPNTFSAPSSAASSIPASGPFGLNAQTGPSASVAAVQPNQPMTVPPAQGSRPQDQQHVAPAASRAAEPLNRNRSDLDDVENALERVRLSKGIMESPFDIKVELPKLQSEQGNPLHSAVLFEDLNLPEDVMKALAQMNFQRPSKVQGVTIPYLIANPPRNVVGQSQSGTGKTGAFAISMIVRVDRSNPNLQCIVIEPTRELARQTYDVVVALAQYTGIKVHLLLPNLTKQKRENTDLEPPKIAGQIMIGTPGITANRVERCPRLVQSVKMLIFDEADFLLKKDNGDTYKQMIQIKNGLPPNIQAALFSATFPPEVRELSEYIVGPHPVKVLLKHKEVSTDTIRQLYVKCPSSQSRYDMLVQIYLTINLGTSIIFCATRAEAENVSRRMIQDNYKTLVLHGDMDVKDRDKAIDDFRIGVSRMLITTDVLARGIDIPSVALVVNFDLPIAHGTNAPAFETYLHRIGRTGRFGKRGVAINMVYDHWSMGMLERIREHFGKPMFEIDAKDVFSMEESYIKAGAIDDPENRAQQNQQAIDARNRNEKLAEERLAAPGAAENQSSAWH